jgi:hypothetical protein
MNLETFLKDCKVDLKRPGEHHHATSGRVQIDCPFCSPDTKRFRLGLTPFWASCWTCGPHYASQILRLVTGQSYDLIKQFQKDSDPLPRSERLPGKLTIPLGVGVLKYAHKQYLRGRDFDWRSIRHKYGIRGIGALNPRFPWCIWIPITFNHQIVTWTTRTIDDTVEPRYISAFPHEGVVDIKKILYGEDWCAHSILVTEGPINVWRIGAGAVGTFGTEYSPAQVFRIARYAKRYICFDSNPEAQKVAKRLCNELAALDDKPTINIKLDSGKDPAEASDKEVKQLRRLLK